MPRLFKGTRVELLPLLPQAAICAEIGVLHGGFAAAILKFTKPYELHLVDLWKQQEPAVYDDKANDPDDEQERRYRVVLHRFRRAISERQVVVHRGYSSDMIPTLPTLAWVYLDANHTQLAVLEDLLLVNSRIRRDGIIVGHDYCEGDDEGRLFGVIPAVTEFLAAHSHYELVFITDEPWPSYVLASSSTAARLLQAAGDRISATGNITHTG